MSAEPKIPAGPMLGVPLTEQKNEFKEWVKTGRRPDDHPAVRDYAICPPDTSSINVLGEVAIKESYADNQSYFACNACNTKRKFKGGGFCAEYGDGYWYIVGPHCGSEGHIKRFGVALRNYRHEQLEAESEDRVARFYQNFDDWITLFEEASDVAAAILKTQNQTLKIEELKRDLKSAKRSDGKLYISRLAVILDDWDKYETIDTKVFASLKGLNFLNRPSIAIGKAKIAKTKLQVIAGEDIEIEYLLDLFSVAQQKKRMRKLRTDVRAAEEAIRELVKSIQEARTFLSHQQISIVDRFYTERRAAEEEIRRSRLSEHASDVPYIRLKNSHGRLQIDFQAKRVVDLDISPILKFESSAPY